MNFYHLILLGLFGSEKPKKMKKILIMLGRGTKTLTLTDPQNSNIKIRRTEQYEGLTQLSDLEVDLAKTLKADSIIFQDEVIVNTSQLKGTELLFLLETLVGNKKEETVLFTNKDQTWLETTAWVLNGKYGEKVIEIT